MNPGIEAVDGHPTRRGRGWSLLVCGALFLCGLAACTASVGAAPGSVTTEGKTIGLLLSGFDYQFYTTPDAKEECPDGLVHSSKENWQAQFPTRRAREAHFNRCGAVDNRGPDCEHVLAAPELIKDPLPYREVNGSKSYGVNLDGTQDGRATATTCAHQKFVHPDGTRGIDNQYYRLMGCQKFVHSAFADPSRWLRRAIVGNRKFRTMLEIRQVDDERNDPQVEVVIHQGRDPLIVDAEDKAVPWQSQRVDQHIPSQNLRGRIVDGELITEPADTIWEDVLVSCCDEPSTLVRGAQLRLRLTESGAQGMRTGYVDVKSWWNLRKYGKYIGSVTQDSPPSLYEALHRLADGYKDPQTGACTALSSGMKLEFVRALILHPGQEDRS